MMKTDKKVSVGLVSLGCSKNTVDSETLLGYLSACGYVITPKPREADVIIINTCGFIDSAKEESIGTILEMAEYKKQGTCSTLCVTGCLSQRYKNELEVELPEVDIFWGVSDYMGFVRKLSARFDIAVPSSCNQAPRILTTPPYSAYLRIADGCKNRCTYCAIPLIRGDMRSENEKTVLAEATRLVQSGVSELNVIAQDTSAYGIDTCGKLMLPELLYKLSRIDGVHWIRLLYTYPDTVTDELVCAIAENEHIVNYIDMPIQHISDRILKCMNRRGDGAYIRDRMSFIRKTADDFIIRTTAITGFPGETEQDFFELCDFFNEYPVDRLGVFPYSEEDGTEAATFPNQVDEYERIMRCEHIMTMQSGISLEQNKKRIAQKCEVLIESACRKGKAVGRSYAEAPDVDGKITIKTGESKLAVGSYVSVEITAATEYDLEGELQ